MTPLEVPRLAAADLPALASEVERARAAGDFRASSDVDAQWFVKSFELDPGADDAEIWTIVVPPDRQGSGFGRQLLRWGVRSLRGLGVRDVSPSVNGGNERVLGRYESEGFARVRTRERWSRSVAVATEPREIGVSLSDDPEHPDREIVR